MKKIIKLFLIIILFLCFNTKTHAEEVNIVLKEAIPGVKIHLKTPKVEKDKSMFQILNTTNNALVYCLEPGVMLYSGNFNVSRTLSGLNLDITDDDWEMLLKYAYFGYNYDGRTDLRWYAATQYVIWEYILDGKGSVEFIEDECEDIEDLKAKVATIKDEAERANVIPSFSTTDYFRHPTYEMKLGEEFVLVDDNDIISKMNDIGINGDFTYRVEGNKLILKANQIGTFLINMSKNGGSLAVPEIYYADSNQTVMSRGLVNISTAFVSIKVAYPDFTVKKVPKEKTNLSVKGATYDLYKENGEYLNTYTTGDDGTFTIESLEYGNYYLIEKSAPRGFILNEEPINFSVTKDNHYLTIEEPLIKKPVVITKNLTKQDGTSLREANAEFDIYDKYDDTLVGHYKTNNNGEINVDLPYGKYILKQTQSTYGFALCENYEFTIDENTEIIKINLQNPEIVKRIIIEKYKVNGDDITTEVGAVFALYQNNILIDTYKTNNQGQIILDLPYGTYTIKQVESPSGYKKVQDITFTIDDTSPNVKTYVLNDNALKKMVILKKYREDADGKLVNEMGAIFNLYNSNHELIDTYTTDKQGLIMLNLEYGTYYLTQEAGTYGYKLIDPLTIVINEDTPEVQEIPLYNSIILKKVNILKYTVDIDGTETLEKDALFRLYDKETGVLIKEFKTNEDGMYSLSLPYGTYTLKQVTTKKGYLLSEDLIITVNENTKDNSNFVIYNPQIKGNLHLFKKDNETKELIKEEATFKLQNMDTLNFVYQNESDILKTIDGEIYIENIPYGNYCLYEISAPKNYRTNEEYCFSLKENNELIEIDYFNEYQKGNLKIVKIDERTNTPLANVKFGLYDINKNLLKEFYTNDLGEILIENLNVGTYYVQELLTLDGYALDDNFYEITINDNETYELTLKNRLKIKLTKTDNWLFSEIIIAALSMVSGGLFIYHVAKKS